MACVLLDALRDRLPFLRVAPPLGEVTCPVCGHAGRTTYPHPYKAWALAGTDDAGNHLRRCRSCEAEIAIRDHWKWWLPTEVWLHSTVPEYGKGERRRRERRAARRAAQEAGSGTVSTSMKSATSAAHRSLTKRT